MRKTVYQWAAGVALPGKIALHSRQCGRRRGRGAGRVLSRLLRSGLSGLAVLSGRWAGARRCAFCRGVWASVYAGACGSVGAFCRRLTPAVCASLPVLCIRLTCRDAGLVCAAMRFLSPRLGFGLCRCLRFCRGVLPSVHACLFSFVRKKETACDSLRSYSAGSRSPFVRSRGALQLSALVGLLRVCAFLYGDLDGLPENGERGSGAGGAAFVRFCVGALVL